ncbi:TPA: phage antirepressor KilAC domain-containing protein [Bacillus pacificus]
MGIKERDIVIEENLGELMSNQAVKQEVTVVTHEGELLDPSNVAQREKYVERVEVLSKVGGLLLLPNMEMATTKQAAEFYEVDQTVIREMIRHHREELESDGMTLQKFNDIKEKVTSDNMTLLSMGVSYRGANLFPRRAILRIGMLLRDSAIAKEVRTQLLNIEGNTSTEVKMLDINEEMRLQMAVGQAFASGDAAALLVASTKMMDFKNRHITQVSEERDKYKAELETINGKDLISLTTVGLEYLGGVSSVKLRKFLQEQGVLRTVKTDGHYVPTIKYAKYFKLSTAIKNDRLCKTMKVTREGASYVAELYKSRNNKKPA